MLQQFRLSPVLVHRALQQWTAKGSQVLARESKWISKGNTEIIKGSVGFHGDENDS